MRRGRIRDIAGALGAHSSGAEMPTRPRARGRVNRRVSPWPANARHDTPGPAYGVGREGCGREPLPKGRTPRWERARGVNANGGGQKCACFRARADSSPLVGCDFFGVMRRGARIHLGNSHSNQHSLDASSRFLAIICVLRRPPGANGTRFSTVSVALKRR